EYEDKIVQLQKEHDTKNEEINEARVKEISEFTQKIKDNEIVIQELSTLKVEIENLKKSHQEQLVEIEKEHALALEQAKERSSQGETVVAIEKLKLKHLDEINELKSVHEKELETSRSEQDSAIKAAEYNIQ
ncbi:14762_t:CDS:2, partial [Entrophospora sp. SA101]